MQIDNILCLRTGMSTISLSLHFLTKGRKFVDFASKLASNFKSKGLPEGSPFFCLNSMSGCFYVAN